MPKFLNPKVSYKSLYFLLFLLATNTAFGFNLANRLSSPNYSINSNLQYGFIIIHRSSIEHFSQSHFSVFQLSYLKQTNGNKTWQQQYHLPRVGVNFLYTNFAHNTLLKSAFGTQAYIDFSKIPFNKNTLHFQLGCGIGYISSVFNKDNNFKNVAIGSHFNGLIQLGFHYQKKITSNIQAKLGISLIHFSNGATRVPNLGINICSGGITLSYVKSKVDISNFHIKDSISSNYKKYLEVTLGGGYKQNYPSGSPTFGVTAMRLQYYFLVKQKNSLSIGTDVFYDNGIYRKFAQDNYVKYSNFSAIQLGLNFQYQQQIGKFSIPIFWGGYILSKYKGNGYFYHGIGLKYKLTNHLQTGVILKTHYAKADYFWWNLAWLF
jgi:hypothetical protein